MATTEQNLMIEAQQLAQEIERMKSHIDAREEILNAKEARLRQNLLTPDGARSMEAQIKGNLPSYLSPGNVGDVNKVIWPFYMRTSNVGSVLPNSNLLSQISVTQEAAFVWTHYVKTVFVRDPNTDVITYINPNVESAAGLAPGLSFSIRDAQSTREFFGGDVSVDQVGNPRFPQRLNAPMLVVPNGVLQVTWQNDNQDLEYIPFLTFFGYRIRIEDAADLLSTVYG